ncbi:hypothetical protein SUNI508_01076 [Seiridium unicorne]|uniref:Uncharacterized protein n=1 Tax=Seiridium unicorne TaxID=138068 RepID=A0ABR2UXM8_9PEZI
MKPIRRNTPLVVACISAALTPSLALPGWPQQGTIVQGNAYQFDQKTWERNLAQPNATGNFSITGFDISKAFPSAQVDGWELSVNVTSSIPDSQVLNPTNTSGKVFTGTSLYLKAPDSVVAGITSADSTDAIDETTWKICVTVMTGGPVEDTSTADNGTCSSLSSQCITDFQNAYADEFAKEQDCYKLPATPSSCGDSLDQANMTTQQFPLTYLNGTEIFVTASDVHDSGDNTAFDSAVKQVWPVLTVWGWNNRANVSDDTKPTVQLTCARANNVQSGSGDSQSAASVTQSSATVALMIAGLMATLLL